MVQNGQFLVRSGLKGAFYKHLCELFLIYIQNFLYVGMFLIYVL